MNQELEVMSRAECNVNPVTSHVGNTGLKSRRKVSECDGWRWVAGIAARRHMQDITLETSDR